jgi:HD-like signal output (HDOD) protein
MEAERERLGCDHCEAGAALATAWNFPQMLVTAILYHHRPELAREETELLQAVHVANLISEDLGLAATSEPEKAVAAAQAQTSGGIPQEVVVRLSQDLPHRLQELLEVIETPRQCLRSKHSVAASRT